jgi:hypothetical protein
MLWKNPHSEILQSFWEQMLHKNLDNNLGKFDAISDEGIFLGYDPNKKAYRCFNFRLHKVVDSEDVKVDELKTQKVENQKSTSNNESEEEEESLGIQNKEEGNEMPEEDMDLEEDE